MLKKITLFQNIATFLFLLALVVPLAASAQGLVPCTNTLVTNKDTGESTVESPCSVCSIFELSQRILNFIYFYITVPIATVMLLWAGFLMVSSGLWAGEAARTKGKAILKNTFIGIFITFFAWLAIDTIIKLAASQDLASGRPATLPQGMESGVPAIDVDVPNPSVETKVSFGPWNQVKCTAPDAPKFAAPSKSAPVPPSTPAQRPQPTPLPEQSPALPGPWLSDNGARTRLLAEGVKVGRDGQCTNQNNATCTSMQDIPAAAVDALLALNRQLKDQCLDCVMRISGGTEAGHQTHGSGKPIVDIATKDDPRIDQFIRSVISTPNPKIDTWYKGGDNQYYFYEGDHWHMCLTSACAPHKVANDQVRGL